MTELSNSRLKQNSKILDFMNERVFNTSEYQFEYVKIPYALKSPSIQLNGRTYVIGGGLPPYNQCFIVNTIDLETQIIKSLNIGRIKHGLVTMCGEIYAIGGISNDFLRSVEKFNGNAWEEIAPLNYSRVQPTSCTVNQEIYVISGNIESKSIEKYKESVWIIIHFQFPVALRRVGVACCGKNLFIAGGNLLTLKSECNYKRAWKIDCNKNEIEELDNLPIYDCFDFSGWESNGKLVMIGQKHYFEYDLTEKHWKMNAIANTCSLCLNNTCRETCKYLKKYQFYKTFKVLKAEYKLL